MKYRNGFVTNSSSSSFICEICGNTESGYDMSLKDAGMVECVNGHTLCEGEVLECTEADKRQMYIESIQREIDNKWRNEVSKNDLREALAYLSNEENSMSDIPNDIQRIVDDESDNGYIPAAACPLCMHTECTEREISKYAAERLGITREQLQELVKADLIAQDKIQK